MKRQLLIATTNTGKAGEIALFLKSLPFLECVTLADTGLSVPAPDEPADDLAGNAFIKAKYYAEHSGMLTLADDSGLFIDALGGWPGVRSARVASGDDARTEAVLERLNGVPGPERSATFKNVLTIYDPETCSSFSAYAETRGIITEAPRQKKAGFGYDPVFYLPELAKTYSELSSVEKNGVSHRGKALIKIKYYLQNTLGSKDIVVPYAMIVRDGKVLMNLRNDPHNPAHHRKWEFPGGAVEFGEDLATNLKREVYEEVGYEVEPLQLLQHIAVKQRTDRTYQYQVYLLPFVCKIVGGDGTYDDNESLATKWFAIDEVLDQELLENNADTYRRNLNEFKAVISTHNL